LLFNSYIFIGVFLPLTLLAYFSVRTTVGRESSFIILCIASLIYYAYWKVSYLPILIISILGNYFLGMMLSGRSEAAVKKGMLIAGVTLNLAALAYYKYSNFFIENLGLIVGKALPSPEIVLPLAISFFTFQQIAYLVDAYRGEVREYKFVHYCLFVTFFPQLIAGPIVHHKEMLPQFMDKARALFDANLFWLGMVQFSIGLFKKVVIADNLAVYATPVFAAADQGVDVSMLEAWIGTLAYTFQLYFDFSGYSDMALGIASMFGIRLPDNFNSPYKSVSISEFWRRWHMTLSRFLRDYLYIALGGNRRGSTRRYVNLFLTMLLGGLWHGASWNFVIWGALHGSYLVINHGWNHICKNYWSDHNFGRVYSVAAVAITFIAVIAAWVVFRAETFSGAVAIYTASLDFSSLSWAQFATNSLAGDNNPVSAIAAIILCAVIAFAFPNSQEIVAITGKSATDRVFWGARVPLIRIGVSVIVSLMLVVAIASMNQISEFLYFQF
jgi:D-alanyl-lipoteichoic acid acyltransferase DltB (MBOAT superfamily)